MALSARPSVVAGSRSVTRGRSGALDTEMCAETVDWGLDSGGVVMFDQSSSGVIQTGLVRGATG
jgi:hypothetical protein